MAVAPQDLARTLQRREQSRRAKAEVRAERLRSRLGDAAKLLVGRYGARRVVLFGSLADGSYSTESDVDLAVEGMPSIHYFRALADLMALFGSPVDLVRTEEAAPSLRACIDEEGKPL